MIPKRWMPNYLDMKALPKELAAGGAAIMVLIEELGAAEAKVAKQTATIAELEEFKKSVLDNCTGCGYSLFLPQEPK